MSLTLICGIFFGNPFFAQETTEDKFRYRLYIFGGGTIQNHYDGNDIMIINKNISTFKRGWLPLGKSLGFGINATDRIAIEASLTSIGINYYQHCFRCAETGALIERWNVIPTILSSYSTRAMNNINLSLIFGVSARFGFENLLEGYGAFDSHILVKDLQDFGPVGGMRISYPILNDRIHMTFDVKHTYFIHRNDRGGVSPYTWDKGSTRQMTVFQFGVRYNLLTIDN
ncbi:MAG: hypothetical protein WEC59_00865 [Salibacteraceae bacterium]